MEERKEFKKEDLEVVQKLVGTKLDVMFETLGMFVIGFVDKDKVEYSLHTFSFVRVRNGSQIILTNFDKYHLPDYSDMPQKMYDKDETHEKSLLFVTLKNTKEAVSDAVVSSVNVTDTADIIITFDNGVVIETFTNFLDKDLEYYRFFEVNEREPHYVVESVNGKIMFYTSPCDDEFVEFMKSEEYLEKQNTMAYISMDREVGFTSEKTKDGKVCFEVILPYASCYEECLQGGVNVFKGEYITFENVIGYVLSKKPRILNWGKKRFNKCYDACLNLLVIPYFDKFYEYIKVHINAIDKKILRMFKSQILSYLVDKKLADLVQTPGDAFAGGKFYVENDCFNKSNELIKLIDFRLSGKKIDATVTKKCKRYIAQIKWLSFEEGGRKMPPPFDTERYAPQIQFEGQNNLDWSVCINNYEWINRYETLARIHYLFYVDAPDNLVQNLKFKLFEGPKLVALGEIVNEIEGEMND